MGEVNKLADEGCESDHTGGPDYCAGCRPAACRHDDPDNSGLCIHCSAVLDPDDDE